MDPVLIATLLPVAVKGVIAIVDKIKGSGGGVEKKPLAVDIVKLIFEALQKTVPGLGLPQDVAEIGKIVQDNVDAMNAAGVLNGHNTILPVSIDAGILTLCASMLEVKAQEIRKIAAKG